MNPVKFLKNYIHRAKKEAIENYSIQTPLSSSTKEKRQAWTGMDLDGTLARDDTLVSLEKIGKPVPKMVARLKTLMESGVKVKIFTARASDNEQISLIKDWLEKNNLPNLEITNVKDYDMVRLYDDRAVQVIANTGEIVEKIEKK
ncbi:MAG: hypothetical protein U9P10_11000 [Thermodesulfobacteriota bacterium]|nr:hypothetical protein [Thermodesulfobacteriota bacterium]